MMSRVWPIALSGFVVGLWTAAWLNIFSPFTSFWMAYILIFPALLGVASWRRRNHRRKPVGYLFELRYSEGRWSSQRMYAETLPTARDYRNAIPLYAD